MKTGFARVDISPQPGEHPEMMGFGPFIGRTALEMLQPIYVRASYLEDEQGSAAVLLAFDLCGLKENLAEVIREAAARAAGLTTDRVIAACTHTHSAPSIMPIIGWGEYDEVTAARLPSLAADATRAAKQELRETFLEAGWTEFADFSCNRVYGDRGPLDISLRTLSFQEKGTRKLLGLWAHYACHPVLLCENCRVISPDFCGVAMQELELKHEESVCSFLQGTCGDINPVLVHMRQERSIVHLAHFAQRFRCAVEKAAASAQAEDCGSVVALSEKLSLPVEIMSEEAIAAFVAYAQLNNEGWEKLASISAPQVRAEAAKLQCMCPPQRTVPIAALRVGEHTLIFHPFEMFTQIGLDIRDHLGPEKTWVIGYTNGYEGYAPTLDRFSPQTGDYAAHIVPLMKGMNPYAPRLGERLAKGLTEIGRRVRAT
jgi:hypothetical protein